MQQRLILLLLITVFIAACTTSPMGRKQFILIGDEQMNQMGVASFQKMKTSAKVSDNHVANRYVRCVANAIVNELPEKWHTQQWEVIVFDDNSANAFALPGGKIGVHTGLLKVAKNQDQLATVIGHEVAHVISRHGAERVSQQMGLQIAIQTTDAISKNTMANQGQQKTLMSALGLGAQFGVLLPFSRSHESEADLYGLDLMAKAGFNPRMSVNLWENMAAASGGRTPEFMSTHPNPENRIKKLSSYMPHALQLSQVAHANGKRPNCK
ncbi:MAG: M48 family metallopeptidase [Alcanivoracaceae bacterium]|nr:M48 family metallopeptidase [Alcanivoracaceae bacterium]